MAVLETPVAQSGAQRIDLIAHGMGNRALIEAMQTYLSKRAPENRQYIFGQLDSPRRMSIATIPWPELRIDAKEPSK
jgi:hypothetical protein